jgi:hypothetical protein
VAGTYGESIESGIRRAITETREKNLLPRGLEVVWADSGRTPPGGGELKMVATACPPVINGATTPGSGPSCRSWAARRGACRPQHRPRPRKTVPAVLQDLPLGRPQAHTAAAFLHERLARNRCSSTKRRVVRGIEPAFRKQFEEALHGSVAAVVSLDEAGWRERSALALDSTGVGAIYVVGFAGETLEVLRHLAEQQFAGRVVASSAFYSTQVIREAGPLAEGVLFPLPPFDRTSEKEPVLGFVNRYMDTYNRAPDVFAAHGYDAMRYTIEVMRPTRPAHRDPPGDAVRGRDFMGVTGPIVFDDFGGVKHYPKMFVVKGGQVLSYERWLDGERSRIFRDVQDILFNKG